MTEPANASVPNRFDEHMPTLVQAVFVHRLGRFGVALLATSILLALVALFTSHETRHHQVALVQQLQAIQTRLHVELAQWNARLLPDSDSGSSTTADVSPLALKALLQFAQQIKPEAVPTGLGALYLQTLQSLTAQAVETLSRPVSGVNSSEIAQARQEQQVRLETLPKITALEQHIAQADNGLLTMLWVLTGLCAAGATALLLTGWRLKTVHQLNQRIHVLSRALHTQAQSDSKLAGAHSALEGVLAALNQNQQLEHRGTLLQIGQQLEELKQSGHAVLEFAKAFHQLSTQGTQVAKTALTSEQRNSRAESHVDMMQSQLEGLRNDIRTAAQGLRKAGEVSRQLLGRLDGSQLELSLSEPGRSQQLQQLVEQSQLALKEAIEGLVLASQKINMGQIESHKLAEFMAVNQTAWANLLGQIEQYTEAASKDSEQALQLAKRLIQSSQAAKAPPQLLP
ncbi:hypothetical protein NQT62_01455 [Limnobacter humi]|uniref:Methyl-accepting transducer domain-containing protein n=1 Tax=Limnobacter humi TaxID=1778671 RepID=A0ABT1WED1_9BURK|nr:hypothetical protein [Limnobacter humi]MCQ8895102.1 hypothetical protein [Limnobacter humi]